MKKRISVILITTLLITILISAPLAQADIGGDDVYFWNVRNVDSTGWEYNSVNRTLIITLVLRSFENTISSYGLALVSVLFNASSTPTNIVAYMMIGNETFEVIDMLKNYTLVEDQSATMDNGTHQWEEDATYFEAFIYMFANHSVINEQPIPRPGFGPWNNSYPPVTLASEIASDTGKVVFAMSYAEQGLPPVDLLLVFGLSAAVVIVIITIVVFFLFFNEDS